MLCSDIFTYFFIALYNGDVKQNLYASIVLAEYYSVLLYQYYE